MEICDLECVYVVVWCLLDRLLVSEAGLSRELGIN